MILILLEPTVIPGLDRALLELAVVFATVIGAVLCLMISSIVGIVRATRRRKRGEQSITAVAFALIAALTTTAWLLYWTVNNLYQHHNPLDGLLAINLALCVLPFCWLLAALRAHPFSTR